VVSPACDEDLLARRSALQQEARQLLAEFELAALTAHVGPLLVTGSLVSGLMSWPDSPAVSISFRLASGSRPRRARPSRLAAGPVMSTSITGSFVFVSVV
jgi:hypothetical protein